MRMREGVRSGREGRRAGSLKKPYATEDEMMCGYVKAKSRASVKTPLLDPSF